MEKSKKTAKSKKNPAKTKKTTKNSGKITKDMLIGELFQKYPDAAMILMQDGVHCVGCGWAAFETIEQGLLLHGKTKKEISAILAKLNRAAK